jgi:hypothetical protein
LNAARGRRFEQTWVQGVAAQEVATSVGLAIDQVYAAKSRVLEQPRAEVLMLAEDFPPIVPLGK